MLPAMPSRSLTAALLLLALAQLAGGVGVLCEDGDDHAAWALSPCGCAGPAGTPASDDGSCDTCDSCEDVQAVVLAPGQRDAEPTWLWAPVDTLLVRWQAPDRWAANQRVVGDDRDRGRPPGPERLVGSVVLTC